MKFLKTIFQRLFGRKKKDIVVTWEILDIQSSFEEIPANHPMRLLYGFTSIHRWPSNPLVSFDEVITQFGKW